MNLVPVSRCQPRIEFLPGLGIHKEEFRPQAYKVAREEFFPRGLVPLEERSEEPGVSGRQQIRVVGNSLSQDYFAIKLETEFKKCIQMYLFLL